MTLPLIKHRQLILQMTRREVVGRYKGSFLGLAWSLFNPILMLTVYTFVFSVVFKSRWAGTPENDHASFAVILFTGLIIFNLFSECIGRAPALITGNVNYVKKVVFPIEILPAVSVLAAMFHMGVSLVVLIAAMIALGTPFHATMVAFPLLLVPLVLGVLGASWILASLGVFVRDVSQTIGILISVLMFLSPIFYPVASLPQRLQPLVLANPLAFIIEQARQVLLFGAWPNWTGLAAHCALAALCALVGFWWFQKTRKGFADVL
ncbi:ABC transporter permease [Paraburkholderia lycopersici]|uniref:Transport permease protein n=1 Tax=Paraburkholderia lycopersici TaxID=416944 RepID=A0A1G6NH76_9BURK|nr:ABC transporter permease [Paraburkholderia lycopersici]SDC66495.1 lipopolysaccharide transport system permease protein [Paraburkholderia lycopersici]